DPVLVCGRAELGEGKKGGRSAAFFCFGGERRGGSVGGWGGGGGEPLQIFCGNCTPPAGAGGETGLLLALSAEIRVTLFQCEIGAEQAHHQHVVIPPVPIQFLPQNPLHLETAFLVSADRPSVEGENRQLDFSEIYLLEGEVSQDADGVGSVSLSLIGLSDGDADPGEAVVPVDVEEGQGTDEFPVQGFHRKQKGILL